MNALTILLGIIAVIGTVVAIYLYVQFTTIKKQEKGGEKLSELEAIEKASEIAKKKLIEAEKRAIEIENKAQDSFTKARGQIKEDERLLDERERKLMQRSKGIDTRFDELEEKDKQLEKTRLTLKEKTDELSLQLEKIAQLTKEEAEALLKSEIQEELKDWITKRIKETESEIQRKSEEVGKKILVETMLNSAVDYVAETTTTTVELDDETLKSRIIGKSGRNVRAFERLTGVDVIIDESPNEVTISCFDPIRREVAVIALKKLLKTGKINPSTIEETITKVKTDVLKEIKKTGEDLVFEAGFSDIPSELIMLLGRFKYRFSYGQNLVKHTLETIKIGEAIANEIGADVRTVKLACLLHDIGKVAPQEGKQHHHISAELAKKYWPKDEKLINAIESHHYDTDAVFAEAEVVRIADAISGARPGARRDSYEDYVKRIRSLEDIANKHTGVKESFAIQAGREVRVIVNPEDVDDDDTKRLAYEIAREIEETQMYPGIVKVSVIREFRVKEEAK